MGNELRAGKMENTNSQIRPQDISRLMRNAGLIMSKDLRQRICYISTSGFAVKNHLGKIRISWTPGHWQNGKEQKEEQFTKLTNLLTEKSYIYTFTQNQFIIEGKK